MRRQYYLVGRDRAETLEQDCLDLNPVSVSVWVSVLAGTRWPNQRGHWRLWGRRPVMEILRGITKKAKAIWVSKRRKLLSPQVWRPKDRELFLKPSKNSSCMKGVAVQKLWSWVGVCIHYRITSWLWVGKGRHKAGLERPHFNCLSLHPHPSRVTPIGWIQTESMDSGIQVL